MSVAAWASRPTGPGGDGGVRADLELIAHEILEPARAVDDENDVRGLATNLKAEAATRQRQERGRRPAVRAARAEDAAAAHAAENEARLDRARKDRDPHRLAENGGRDRLVPGGHDFAERSSWRPHALGIVTLLLRPRLRVKEREKQTASHGGRRQFFHVGMITLEPGPFWSPPNSDELRARRCGNCRRGSLSSLRPSTRPAPSRKPSGNRSRSVTSPPAFSSVGLSGVGLRLGAVP